MGLALGVRAAALHALPHAAQSAPSALCSRSQQPTRPCYWPLYRPVALAVALACLLTHSLTYLLACLLTLQVLRLPRLPAAHAPTHLRRLQGEEDAQPEPPTLTLTLTLTLPLTIILPPFTVTVTAHRSPLTVHPNPHPKQEPTDGAEDGDEDEEDEDDEEAVLGMWGAVFWLAVITVSA